MSSTDAEAVLLGLMLADVRDYERALAMGVHAAHFTDDEHRAIFLAMAEAEKAGQRPNVPAVVRQSQSLGFKAAELRKAAPVAEGIEAYVGELKTLHRIREATNEVLGLGRALNARKPFSPVEDVEKLIAASADRLLTSETPGGRGPQEIRGALDDLIAKMQEQEALKAAGKSLRIPTGFPVLDIVTGGGFRPGSFNTFAARTGRGKTTLALNFLLKAARAGKACCYFSVEMPNVDLIRKLVSRVCELNATRLSNLELDDEEFHRMHNAVADLAKLPIVFHDKTGASLEAVEATCRRLKRQGKLDLIVIDYLQQFSTARKHRTIYERVVEVSERVKALALELDIAVIALAQLNREAEKVEKPTAMHIKESGQIEQDSDLVVLIHYDERDGVGLYVDKNRWGRDKFVFPVRADLALNLFDHVPLNMEAFK